MSMIPGLVDDVVPLILEHCSAITLHKLRFVSKGFYVMIEDPFGGDFLNFCGYQLEEDPTYFLDKKYHKPRMSRFLIALALARFRHIKIPDYSTSPVIVKCTTKENGSFDTQYIWNGSVILVVPSLRIKYKTDLYDINKIINRYDEIDIIAMISALRQFFRVDIDPGKFHHWSEDDIYIKPRKYIYGVDYINQALAKI